MPKMGEVNVDSLIATHAAIAAAHHTKYTNAEALAAAKAGAGTSALNLVQLDASAKLPAVNGSQLTGLTSTFAALTDIKLVRKSVDESIANNNTPQNDDELFFAMGANEVWECILLLITYSASVTPDINLAFGLPSGAVLYGHACYHDYNGTAQTGTFSGTDVICAYASTGIFLIGRFHMIIVNGSTAGNFQIKWAQRTADATPSTVKANSCLLAHKLA